MNDSLTLSGNLTLGRAEQILSSNRVPEEWTTLDLSDVEFARSDALLLLLAVSVDQSQRLGRPLWLRLPTNPSVVRFLGTARFFSLLATTRTFANAEELSARLEGDQRRMQFQFIPPCRDFARQRAHFESECATFLNVTSDRLTSDMGARRFAFDAIDELWHATKEIYENVFVHSTGWGCAVVQPFERGNRAIVSVCMDVGIGIRQSLAPLLDRTYGLENERSSDAFAIMEAVKDGVSSRRSGEIAGYGLGICRSFGERYGWLYIRSGSAGVRFRRGNTPEVLRVKPARGTLVVLALAPAVG